MVTRTTAPGILLFLDPWRQAPTVRDPAGERLEAVFQGPCQEFPALRQNYFHSQRDRSAQPHLNRQQLEATAIPLPTRTEQRQIAEMLRTVDQKLGKEDSRSETLDALFQTLLHHLMTGRLRANQIDLAALETVETVLNSGKA